MSGSLLVLNGVRVWVQALRRHHCPIWGLHHLLRAQGVTDGLQPFHVFLLNMCANAGRKLDIRQVGSRQLSADENAILSAVTQFQQGNEAEAEQALLKLVPHAALPRTSTPLSAFSRHLCHAGLATMHVSPPEAATVH